MRKLSCIVIIGFCSWVMEVNGQVLSPGFDKMEYRELMLLNTRTAAVKTYYEKFEEPKEFRMIYQSPVLGLDNLWDLWKNQGGSKAVISIRGTTQNAISWGANLYAAMVAADGYLLLDKTDTFQYKLAQSNKAAVHVGWLVGMAYLSRDILPRIDSLYKTGTKHFLLMGHSQGGAITYLLTAYLYQLQKSGRLPADIRFKTYASAGPKPGNLYFAYEYEAMTEGGWAFNVVNAADWVPEVPLSVQTVKDFNNTNPFNNVSAIIKKQGFFKRLVLGHVYRTMTTPSFKAQRRYQKYLGKLSSKTIKGHIKTFIPPAYFPSSDYVRTGNYIVLLPDSDYYTRFPDSKENVFVHHLHEPYLYLLERK